MKHEQRSEEERLNPGHTGVRDFLRIAGPLVLLVGISLMATGLIDLFSADLHNRPTKFWCFFVGMPILFIGTVMSKIGYLGAVVRYMAAEQSPVAKDTFNYLASGTQEGVRDIATAIRDGIVGNEAGRLMVCPSCKQPNDADARFCDACGVQVSGEKDCVTCGIPNDYDAKFCDGCGSSFST